MIYQGTWIFRNFMTSTLTIFFLFLCSTCSTSIISSVSPRLISLEYGYEIEAGDYGFFSLTPVSSFDDITSQLKTPRSSPRIKVTKSSRVMASETNCSSSTSATSSTRSRRNSLESDPYADLESGDYAEMPVSSASPSSSPKTLPCTLIRRYCCCCLSDSCLNCFKLIWYIFYYVFYGLFLRFTSSMTVEPARTN